MCGRKGTGAVGREEVVYEREQVRWERNRCGGKRTGVVGREEVEYERKRCIVKGTGAV